MLVKLENTTRKLCIIGDPVVHSKSPLVQNTMLQALGLDYVYLCQPVPRGRTGAWLSAAREAGYAGFNATMPHKSALVPLMDELDEDARLYQAVNTVCIKEEKVCGYNTDGKGFLQALLDAGSPPAGKRVLLLGAGGAARSVALKLASEGAAAIAVSNRTLEKAESLCELNSSVMRPVGLDPETLRHEASQADLVVNCTSLGMKGVQGQFSDFSFLEELPAGGAVCDLIYSPEKTELLARAEKRGLLTLNGMGMLIHQAIFALELFTGARIDRAAMGELVKKTLGNC